ncbi:alpha/beta hydrolase [Pontibacter korlensis]|uniref:AB hydrolase-1 domain-containing protein n=1 Tax=Pontibacter korlensis TaxID=400092 RepID=A0A0E3ZIJ0_9BACT|nr:alpha/beta hydrolase [Pontibacter korlensis]AKD05078.1 hypothetical protein PKOR_20865 [Pontibacter korlensis]
MEILVANQATRLYTVTYPNKGKETVILLHGGPGVPDGLDPVAEYLSRYFQVITFHQRGTLNSPCYSNEYSMDRYLSDIDSIAERFDLEKFHLLGHSWGGLYAQIYAYQNPHRLLSMFLCSPASGTGKQWREMTMEVTRFNKRKTTQGEWFAMLKNAALGLLGSDAGYERFYTQFCLNCNKGYQVENPVPLMIDRISAKPINRTNFAILRHSELEMLPDQGFRITVTYSDDDIYGDSTKYVKERYPYAHFITIPNSSHFPWLHNEGYFYSVLAGHYGVNSSTF